MSTMLPIKVNHGVALNTLDDMQRMAKIFIASGLFEITDKEAARGATVETKIAQAVVKMQAGMELGIPPFTAMKDLSIVKGKIQLSYQLLLAKVRQTPGYDYKIVELEDICVQIEFFKDGKSLGISKYDMQDAEKSEVPLYMYKKYPRNMLAARATSNGINIYCPEVTRGSVYVPEDFGGISEENGTSKNGAQEEEISIPRQLLLSDESSSQECKNENQGSDSRTITGSKTRVVRQSKSTAVADGTHSEIRVEAARSEEIKHVLEHDSPPKDEKLVGETNEPRNKHAEVAINKRQLMDFLQIVLANGWTEEEASSYLEESYGVNEETVMTLNPAQLDLALKFKFGVKK